MNPASRPLFRQPAAIAIAAIATALLGAAFSLWLAQGRQLFANLAQSGLAWCF